MKTALLIIDVQNALCRGQWAVFDVENVVNRINHLSKAARSVGVPVVLIQHEEAEGPLQFASEGWQIYDNLQTAESDLRLRKTASDSFHKTDLQAILSSTGVDHLVITGMQSDFCVDSTVRIALSLGYSVTLVQDGHSTLDNGVLTAAQISAHHNLTLSNLASYGPRVKVIPANLVHFES